jgi:hypothetical protein
MALFKSRATAQAQTNGPSGTPGLGSTNVHSAIAGNGQHYVAPARTGHQPWEGHMGRSPAGHPFGPAEGFEPVSGFGVAVANTGSAIQRTTAQAVNSQTGTAAGQRQMRPSLPAIGRPS